MTVDRSYPPDDDQIAAIRVLRREGWTEDRIRRLLRVGRTTYYHRCKRLEHFEREARGSGLFSMTG